MTVATNIYGDRDPRELPTYPLTEAAQHLRLSPSTLGHWSRGRGRLIVPASVRPITFSFFNLMEAHVLAALRRKHRIAMPKVRRALDYVGRELKQKRPLIEQAFRTDGVDLFVDVCGQIVSASEGGQQIIRETIELALERVEHDEAGLVARLHPWTHALNEPKVVVIDPRRSFGRPVIAGTHIRADLLAERFSAGDPIAMLAEDYKLTHEQVEYALRWATRAA